MKVKSTLILSILTGILLISIVNATPIRNYKSVGLTTKNPSTWEATDISAGNLFFFQQQEVKWVYKPAWGFSVKTYIWNDYVDLSSYDLTPNTQYTLIYYGYGSNNDVWPYATCIKTVTSNSWGSLTSYNIPYKYSQFLNNGKAEKFWLVPTRDLDCVNHKLIAWNPDTILFETTTI